MKLSETSLSPIDHGFTARSDQEPMISLALTQSPGGSLQACVIFGLVFLAGLGLDAFFHTHGISVRRAVRMDMAFALALSAMALGLAAALRVLQRHDDASLYGAANPNNGSGFYTRGPHSRYIGLSAVYASVCLAADRPIALTLLPVAIIIQLAAIGLRSAHMPR